MNDSIIYDTASLFFPKYDSEQERYILLFKNYNRSKSKVGIIREKLKFSYQWDLIGTILNF